MYRKCVTEVSVRHQKQTEDALLLLMGKMPYEDITVTELCRTAGISRRVFYHLFSSKADALSALIDHVILASVTHAPHIRDEVLRFVLYWQQQRSLLDSLQANQLTGFLLERMIACILSEDYDVRHWLKTNGWEQQRDVIIFHLSGTMGLIYRWYFSGFRESPEEMAASLKKILTTPLAKNL